MELQPAGIGRPELGADLLRFSDLLQRAGASDEVSRRSIQPFRCTMASTHTGT